MACPRIYCLVRKSVDVLSLKWDIKPDSFAPTFRCKIHWHNKNREYFVLKVKCVEYFSRYLKGNVELDLAKKMLFLAGSRQVGKATFAKALLANNNIPVERFLNWDAAEDRE